MSSTGTTPYTIPYTGSSGDCVAGGVVPASSMKTTPGPGACPPATCNKPDKQSYQAPSVADAPMSPNSSADKGESIGIGSGSVNVTSDINSAARRSSVVTPATSGPSDDIPARFASAAANAGITIVKPEDYQSEGIHASPMTGESSNKNQHQGTSAFDLDGSADDFVPQANAGEQMQSCQFGSPAFLINHLTSNLRASQQENYRLSHTVGFYHCVHISMHRKLDNAKLALADAVAKNECLVSMVKRLVVEKSRTEVFNEHLINTIVRLDGQIHRIDPTILSALPSEVQLMIADIREEWKYQEWYKAFHNEETRSEVEEALDDEEILDLTADTAGLDI